MSSISYFARNLRIIGVRHQRWNIQGNSALRRCAAFSSAANAAPKSTPTAQQTLHPSGFTPHRAWPKNGSADSNEYMKLRSSAISALKKSGTDPYPHKFYLTMSLPEFIERYGSLENGESHANVVSVAGRIYQKWVSGSHLIFYNLHGEGSNIVVMADSRESLNFEDVHGHLRRGDVVGVTGYPVKTATGELRIVPKTMNLLAPCLHMIPDSLKDAETRHRQRYLDLMINNHITERFVTRSKIMSYTRQFFESLGFLEVETPMMNNIAGGASAIPFVTHHNHFNKDIFMRVAPELYLKMLVIGGMDKVFEIGKQFRNEDIDRTHNTEFTTCEFYMAYADYHDLLQITEKLISGMVKEIMGTYKIKYHPSADKVHEVDFTPPFRRISIIAELEKQIGITFPPASTFASSGEHSMFAMFAFFWRDIITDIICFTLAVATDLTDGTWLDFQTFVDKLCLKHGVDCSHPRTTARLLDKLVKKFVEVQCINPTFIMDHPEIMSPLSKGHRSVPGLTERFELFVCQTEVADAYTDLNDPIVTRERFEQQLKDKSMGDAEAQAGDDNFFTALEYGLPPTGGWGMGIDRLCMFLTDSPDIKEVMCFPKP